MTKAYSIFLTVLFTVFIGGVLVLVFYITYFSFHKFMKSL